MGRWVNMCLIRPWVLVPSPRKRTLLHGLSGAHCPEDCLILRKDRPMKTVSFYRKRLKFGLMAEASRLWSLGPPPLQGRKRLSLLHYWKQNRIYPWQQRNLPETPRPHGSHLPPFTALEGGPASASCFTIAHPAASLPSVLPISPF